MVAAMQSPISEDLVCVEIDGPIGIVRLNRPQKLNALNAPLATALAGQLDAFEADASILVVVVGGSTERAFSAGADMREQLDQMEGGKTVHGETIMQATMRLLATAASMKKPTIGVVEGYCYGAGLLLALSLDILVASETALFKNPGVELGSAVGVVKLHSMLGPSAAKEFIMTSDAIDGVEAHRIGLINHVTSGKEAWPKGLGIARRIARNSPEAVAAVKRLVDEAAANADVSALEVEIRKDLRDSNKFASRYRDAVEQKLG
jgi:enoyl-CoA hydratase